MTFFPVIVASSGFDTILISAMPSKPISFSKSTYPFLSLLTFSIDMPKYVPFELDLRMVPHRGAGASDIVMCRKRALVLDSRTVYAYDELKVNQEVGFREEQWNSLT